MIGSSHNVQHILLAGLPGAGKTSFLAAFWDALNSPGDRRLRLVSPPDNRRYLEEARARLQNLQSSVRNPRTLQAVQMEVATKSGTIAEVSVPDMAGDLYDDYWETREWSAEFDQIIEDLTGVLLFLHAEQIATPVSLDDIGQLAAAAAGGEPGSPAGQTPDVAWDPRMAPIQVKLVDLLQMLEFRRGRPRPLGLVVMVSAWDRVKKMQPDEWLVRSAPLLAHFLNNSEFWKIGRASCRERV